MMEKRMLKKVSTVTAAGIMMTAMLGMQVLPVILLPSI